MAKVQLAVGRDDRAAWLFKLSLPTRHGLIKGRIRYDAELLNHYVSNRLETVPAL